MLLVTMSGKNFGAILQAYALFQVIKQKNPSITMLNYSVKSLSVQFRVFRNVKSVKDIFYNLLVIPKARKIKIANQRFLEFRNDSFAFTNAYTTENEIYNSPPEADIYLVGSDQVWNPEIHFSPVYFLNFGSSVIRRYSYSASIGLSSLPSEYISIFQKYLARFDSISVREESAESILRKIGIQSQTTVDPTLLLSKEEWAEIAVGPHKYNEYILVYSLYNSELLELVSERIRYLTHCKVIFLATSVRLRSFGDEIIWDAGPREFIGLIKNAAYIVTSSYHGMLFSLIFEKSFFVIPPSNTSSRFFDFLSSINLKERMIKEIEEVTEDMLVMRQNNIPLEKKIELSKNYIDGIV